VCVLLKVMSSELEKIMQEQVRQDDTWLQQYLSELLWCESLPFSYSATAPRSQVAAAPLPPAVSFEYVSCTSVVGQLLRNLAFHKLRVRRNVPQSLKARYTAEKFNNLLSALGYSAHWRIGVLVSAHWHIPDTPICGRVNCSTSAVSEFSEK